MSTTSPPTPDDLEADYDEIEVDVDEPSVNATEDPFLPVDDGGEPSSFSLFPGDLGQLDLASRKALQAIVKWEFISGTRYPAEWKALMANRFEITRRLHELFLDLYVDTERQVAFKRQAAADGVTKFPTLLYDRSWSREETVLLVYLRTLIRSAAASGSTRFFVERADMLEHVDLLRPATATDRKGDKTATSNAIKALHGTGLLIGRKDDDRFEIDRAIEVLMPLDRLTQLLAWITSDANVPSADGDASGEAGAGGFSSDLANDGSTLL